MCVCVIRGMTVKLRKSDKEKVRVGERRKSERDCERKRVRGS